MQLKLTTGYVVRILVYLAKREGKVTPSAELSESLNISQKYILRLGVKLRNAGLIITHPGTEGGYTLKKPAEEISLIDIITLIEGTIKMLCCMEDPSCCGEGVSEKCEMRSCFAPLQDHLESYLRSVTIADLAEKEKAENESDEDKEDLAPPVAAEQ